MQFNYPDIILHKGKERSLLHKHPWVFSGAIAHEPSGLKEGEVVCVRASDKSYLATGHWHKGTITVRCFDFTGSEPDANFWKKKLAEAIQYRKTIGLPDAEHTNCYRLIHGEGDGFPGLVVDVYGNTLVMQSYTAGMHQLKPVLTTALSELLADQVSAIYDKSAETMAKQSVVATQDGYLWKAPGYEVPTQVYESGIAYAVDWIDGQKTGFFLDQRDNRSLIRNLSAGKKVLNTFCYTGGFSLAALAGGASEVHSVDSSRKAIEGLERNISLNFSEANHQAYTADVMKFLKGSEEMYDLIILDPPAYAKHLSQVKQAMIGYRNLNTEGFRKLKKGAILFTFSCSQAVDKELFRKLVFQAAVQAGRQARIIHQLDQPADHPIALFHPETEYLKGLALYVE